MSKYRITLDGRIYEMEVELVDENAVRPAAPKAEPKESKPAVQNTVSKPAEAPKAVSNSAGAVAAPMPGTIIRIEKEEGSAVKAGEVVLVLEAMKMENDIAAPKDGTIVKMNCKAGGTVAGGDILFEVE